MSNYEQYREEHRKNRNQLFFNDIPVEIYPLKKQSMKMVIAGIEVTIPSKAITVNTGTHIVKIQKWARQYMNQEQRKAVGL